MKRTYHYDEQTKTMVEGPAPSRVEASGDGWRYSDRLYSDSPFAATDGTIIDSRKKHREYMKRNGLTTVDDFKHSWDDASRQREKFYKEGCDREERKQEIARAIDKLSR